MTWRSILLATALAVSAACDVGVSVQQRRAAQDARLATATAATPDADRWRWHTEPCYSLAEVVRVLDHLPRSAAIDAKVVTTHGGMEPFAPYAVLYRAP